MFGLVWKVWLYRRHSKSNQLIKITMTINYSASITRCTLLRLTTYPGGANSKAPTRYTLQTKCNPFEISNFSMFWNNVPNLPIMSMSEGVPCAVTWMEYSSDKKKPFLADFVFWLSLVVVPEKTNARSRDVVVNMKKRYSLKAVSIYCLSVDLKCCDLQQSQ